MCGANPHPHIPQNCNLRRYSYFFPSKVPLVAHRTVRVSPAESDALSETASISLRRSRPLRYRRTAFKENIVDIKYKGISKKDITKIQEIHMPKFSTPTIDDYALAQLKTFERKEVSNAIDNVWKQNENDLNIYIVCELAKKYLDVMGDIK